MKRLTALTLIVAFASSSAFAEGCNDHQTTHESVIGADGQSADLCNTPTSVAPSPDAETWPCKNFSS